MLQAHELGDVLHIHGHCVEVLARGKKSEEVLHAVRVELPLLHFIFRRVWLHAFKQSSCVADAFFEAAEVMIGGSKKCFVYSVL